MKILLLIKWKLSWNGVLFPAQFKGTLSWITKNVNFSEEDRWWNDVDFFLWNKTKNIFFNNHITFIYFLNIFLLLSIYNSFTISLYQQYQISLKIFLSVLPFPLSYPIIPSVWYITDLYFIFALDIYYFFLLWFHIKQFESHKISSYIFECWTWESIQYLSRVACPPSFYVFIISWNFLLALIFQFADKFSWTDWR